MDNRDSKKGAWDDSSSHAPSHTEQRSAKARADAVTSATVSGLHNMLEMYERYHTIDSQAIAGEDDLSEDGISGMFETSADRVTTASSSGLLESFEERQKDPQTCIPIKPHAVAGASNEAYEGLYYTAELEERQRAAREAGVFLEEDAAERGDAQSGASRRDAKSRASHKARKHGVSQNDSKSSASRNDAETGASRCDAKSSASHKGKKAGSRGRSRDAAAVADECGPQPDNYTSSTVDSMIAYCEEMERLYPDRAVDTSAMPPAGRVPHDGETLQVRIGLKKPKADDGN